MAKRTAVGSIGGAAIGGYFGGPQGAAAGAQIGGSIGAAFEPSGQGYNTYRSHYRKLTKWTGAFNERQTMRNLERFPSAMVRGAQKAGLHPLLAMGAGIPGGSSQPLSVGNAASDVGGNHYSYNGPTAAEVAAMDESSARKDLLEAQTEQTKAMTQIELSKQASEAARLRQKMNQTKTGLPTPADKEQARGSIRLGNTQLTNQSFSTLDDIGEVYGDETADIVGLARMVSDWADQRFKPAVKTLAKEGKNTLRKK